MSTPNRFINNLVNEVDVGLSVNRRIPKTGVRTLVDNVNVLTVLVL